MTKIRVLIADDHAIVREGVHMILEAQPDLEVVDHAADGREAVDKARQLLPDVVLMDIAMPGMNGFEATIAIKKELPNIQILALTMHDDSDHFFQALHAGASGYVLKGAPSASLLFAIRAVHKGEVYLHPSVTTHLVSDFLKRMEPGKEKHRYDGLTKRQRQVLTLIADGKTSQEIADELFLSVNTIRTHRTRTMEKLNIHNRAELIRYAIRKGLVPE